MSFFPGSGLPVICATVFASGLAEDLGQALGWVWLGYAIVLFTTTATGLSFGAFLLFAALAGREEGPPRWLRWGVLPVEIYFCLLNPLAYLLILVRTSGDAELFVDVGPSALDLLAWPLLAGLWALRLGTAGGGERGRRWARPLLAAALALLAIYLLRDLLLAVEGPPRVLRSLRSWAEVPQTAVYLLGLAGLYLTPAAILARYLAASACPQRWRRGTGFVFAPRRLGTAVVLSSLALGASTLLAAELNPSAARVREHLLSNRESIQRAARSTGTDPRLLAALLYVVQHRQSSLLGIELERVLARAWLSDPVSYLMLSDSVNPSIGPAQVKPVTAQTALYLVEGDPSAERRQRFLPKQYREVPRLGASWQLPTGLLAGLEADASWFPGRTQVVAGLLDPEQATWMAALILELHARQWESADPSWSIRDRPEILATLYQLGFERSRPKADPGSNAFGDAVKGAMAEAWIEAGFRPSLAIDPVDR